MRRSKASVETPITQMIDIVFLLIIFFVVTASVDKDLSDSEVKLPKAPNAKSDEEDTVQSIVVNVKQTPGNASFCVISLGQQPCTGEELLQKMKDLGSSLGTAVPVLIRCDGAIPYDTLHKLIRNAIAPAGFKKVSLVAEVAAE